MSTPSRFFKHIFTTRASAKRAFSPETLKRIEEAVTEGETRHRAEVRVVVESSLSGRDVLAKVQPRQRAVALFAQFGIWDTEENCGVLVYVNMADRKVEIVADRDVSRRNPKEEWNDICHTMTKGFAQGKFCESTIAAVQHLNALLETHYPDIGVVNNQLPNKPVVL